VPFTNKSLAFLWLITFGLFSLTASGVVTGPWLLPLLLFALAAPVLTLRGRHPVHVIARSPERPTIVAASRRRSPKGNSAIHLSQWENEGGARRT
jgi:hypothetical protein